MKAHLIGSGIASLATAVYLIQNTDIAPDDITIYETQPTPGGAMTASWTEEDHTGAKRRAYILPATRIMEREYRCAYELFSRFASVSDPNQSLDEDIHDFNWHYPYQDTTRLLDRAPIPKSSRRFGVEFRDSLKLLWLMFRRESTLDDKSIEDWGRWRFSENFYNSEFWVAWSTMMGPRRDHSAIEMRRYLLRFLHVVPDVADMTTIWRMRMNQNDSVARPICDWLKALGVNFESNAVVEDVSIDPARGGLAATKIRVSLPTGAKEIPIAYDGERPDVVFMTLGSQVADMTVGAWDRAPGMTLRPAGSRTLWEKIAERHPKFGRPQKFFPNDGGTGSDRERAPGESTSHLPWVTFTITAYGPTFLACLSRLTKVDATRAGLITLADWPWLITISPCPKPHFLGQPDNASVVWGYSICPESRVEGRPMWDYTGKEILTETVRELGFGKYLPQIEAECECIPCCLPYANSVWMVRNNLDRPQVVPSGAKNFAFIGQFCEMPKDTMFTLEYSVRSAREAVSRLPGVRMKPMKPIPVYQAWRDPLALIAAARAFIF